MQDNARPHTAGETMKFLRRREDEDDVLTYVTRTLHESPHDRFRWELQNLKQHCTVVIAANGDYITK